ncbi:MAG: hypothetical protein QME64_09625 [bacterium]|nr:hypothetical protein [bacterium]
MALLPNHEYAIISLVKLRDYILSPFHPIGKFKAKFFEQAGYTQESWEILEKDIREQHLTQEAKEVNPSPFGKKYIITAPLKGPSTVIIITSVWIILTGEEIPRLITLIPGGDLDEI